MANTNVASVRTQSPLPNNKTSSVPPKEYGVDSINDSILGVNDAIPIIDYSLLTSDDPDQRSQAIQNLGTTCIEYGFFTVLIINFHTIFLDAIFIPIYWNPCTAVKVY